MYIEIMLSKDSDMGWCDCNEKSKSALLSLVLVLHILDARLAILGLILAALHAAYSKIEHLHAAPTGQRSASHTASDGE